jgi:hypothetical protein
MATIRRFPHPGRRDSFRRRLHRALSLSSSESEDSQSPSRSAAADIREDDEFTQEENDHSSRQRRGNAVDRIEEDARHDWNAGPRHEVELSIPQEHGLPGNNMMAVQCITE